MIILNIRRLGHHGVGCRGRVHDNTILAGHDVIAIVMVWQCNGQCRLAQVHTPPECQAHGVDTWNVPGYFKALLHCQTAASACCLGSAHGITVITGSKEANIAKNNIMLQLIFNSVMLQACRICCTAYRVGGKDSFLSLTSPPSSPVIAALLATVLTFNT